MLTGHQLGLRAVLVNDDDRDRTVDLGFRAGYPDPDQARRRWCGASTLAQPSEPGRDPHAAISGLSRSNPEHVPDKIPGWVLLQPCAGVPQPQHSPKVARPEMMALAWAIWGPPSGVLLEDVVDI
jgi:hypothetical protein